MEGDGRRRRRRRPTVVAEIDGRRRRRPSPTPATWPPRTAPQALVDAAVERFGRIDVARQQRRDHAVGAASPTSTREDLDAPPRRARRRLVPHRPGRVAAPRRAGLRPHRDDDLDRACSGCPATPPTPPPRAASSAWPAAWPSPAPSTASRSTASRRRRRPGWRAGGEGRRDAAEELVAPMVAYLAHEDCPVSGEIYTAGAGRFARLFIALDRGLRARGRGADGRGRRRALGRRSTTRPATPSPPTSWTGRTRFLSHLPDGPTGP